jgi:hypothetical protein
MRAQALGPAGAWPDAAAGSVSRGLFLRAVPAILLAGLGLVAFRGVLAGRVLYLRDAVQNHGPLRGLVADRLRSGEWPLWNPFHGAGSPLLANPDALVFHPTTLLFLLCPAQTALTLSVVLMTGLLALGGWLLGREEGARPEGAALAAAVLAFSGPAASLASMQNVLAAFAFVPLALWALVRAARAGSPGRIAGAAAAAAPILIAAEPASLLAWLGCGAVLTLTPGPGSGDRPSRARVVLTLGAVAGLAALLAAPQILPARELLPWTPRASGLPAAESLRWSLLPGRLAEVLVPRLFGDPTRLSPGAWWGRFAFEGGYPFLLSVHLGAIPCLLAAIGVAAGGPGGVRRRALGVVGASGLLLALGQHAAIDRALHAVLPAARQIRYPERFLLVALPVVALLAAAGLDRILDRRVGRRAAPALLAAAAVAAFALVTGVAATPGLVDATLSRLAAVPAALWSGSTGATIRGAALTSCLWLFAETAVLAVAAALVLRAPAARPARGPGFALVACAGLSTVLAASPALSTAAPGWLSAPSPLRDAVGRGAGAPRLHHEPRPAGLSVWARTDEVIWGFRFDRFSYALLTGHPDRVPTVFDAATDRMDLAAQAEAGKALERLSLDERLKVLRVAHAGFLLSHADHRHPGLRPGPALEGFSIPPLRLFRIEGVLPRARFRAAARPPARPGDPVRSLADPRYDPGREVLVDDAPSEPVQSLEDEVPVTIAEDRPERIRLVVEAPRPGWVVLADAWAPGWRATVDGAPAAILRADGLFRAVPVPAGRHEVEMTYAPRGLRAGLGLGALGLLIAGTLALGGRFRGRP